MTRIGIITRLIFRLRASALQHPTRLRESDMSLRIPPFYNSSAKPFLANRVTFNPENEGESGAFVSRKQISEPSRNSTPHAVLRELFHSIESVANKSLRFRRRCQQPLPVSRNAAGRTRRIAGKKLDASDPRAEGAPRKRSVRTESLANQLLAGKALPSFAVAWIRLNSPARPLAESKRLHSPQAALLHRVGGAYVSQTHNRQQNASGKRGTAHDIVHRT